MNGEKKVVDVQNATIKSVPCDYVECGICCEYQSRECYGESDTCISCDALSQSDRNKKQRRTREMLWNSDYKNLRNTVILQNALLNASSVSVAEMIAVLQILPKNARLVIKQDGYYADSPYAQIWTAEHAGAVDGIDYYSIGESIQNY